MRCASGDDAVCGSARNDTADATSCARSLGSGADMACLFVGFTELS